MSYKFKEGDVVESLVEAGALRKGERYTIVMSLRGSSGEQLLTLLGFSSSYLFNIDCFKPVGEYMQGENGHWVDISGWQFRAMTFFGSIIFIIYLLITIYMEIKK